MSADQPDLPDFVSLVEADMARAQAAAGAPPMSVLISDGRSGPGDRDPYRPRYGERSSIGVGELILSARELTGMSQVGLANAAGTSQSAISHMESGARLPTLRTLLTIAESAGFELVVGLRDPDRATIEALGLLLRDQGDGLADFVPMVTPSVLDGVERRTQP